MRAMSGHKEFPLLLHSGRHSVFGRSSDVLVMEMLGKSVEARFLAKGDDAVGGKGASARAAVQRIGRDALRCLRRLHEAGFVHNDVKPMNILFGAAGSCREDKVLELAFFSSGRYPGRTPGRKLPKQNSFHFSRVFK